MFIVVSISLVLITEALNTGIENAIDLITQGQRHLAAKAAKTSLPEPFFVPLYCYNHRYDYFYPSV